jgi:2,4-diaminopentanoate dehydrogenase
MTTETGEAVPVVVMGLGFIGRQIAKAAAASPELELVGAVDQSEALVGKPLSELVQGLDFHGKVARKLDDLPKQSLKGAVLLHATGSRLPSVMAELLDAVGRGMSVVSTCEELALPAVRHPELAEQLDAAAQKAGVSVLGTGVNPGFVLDRLVATLGQACGEVRKVEASRVVDARTRREALQRKVGAGLSEDEFFRLVDDEKLGHVGLVESAALCALGLGMDCDDFEEEIAPVIAQEDIPGKVPVKAGQVAGVAQAAIGTLDGVERVRISLVIAVGADDPGDRILIDADPPIDVAIRGGIAGDEATANTVIHAAARVAAAQPGLLTVLDLPAGR